MAKRYKKIVEDSPPDSQVLDSSSKNAPTELPALPKDKVSFAPVGLLTIVFSITSVIFLFFSNFSDQHAYIPPVKPEIAATVTLTASQFETFSNSNVCNGKGVLAGLPNAKLLVEGKNWSRSEKLGPGTLNTQSQCVYTPSFDAPAAFAGGAVKAIIIFSSARSETFTFDLGAYPPYKRIRISLTLG